MTAYVLFQANYQRATGQYTGSIPIAAYADFERAIENAKNWKDVIRPAKSSSDWTYRHVVVKCEGVEVVYGSDAVEETPG